MTPTRPFIFISHSSEDKTLAQALRSLLATGMDITSKHVVCTSLDGFELDAGVEVAATIKRLLQDSTLVILLLTENYQSSPYCLIEMGAAWALDVKVAPLVVPPLLPDRFEHVLKDVSAKMINVASHLDDLRELISDTLNVPQTKTPLWNAERRTFLAGLEPILESLPKPMIASRELLDDAEAELKAQAQQMATRDAEIRRLQTLVDGIMEDLKYEEAVQMRLDSLGEADAFRELVDDALSAIKRFGPVVREALYHHYKGDGYQIDRDYPDQIQEAKLADQYGMVEFDNQYNNVEIDRANPQISSALTVLDRLDSFLREPTDVFEEWYVGRYGHQPDIANRGLWDEHLGL